MDEGNATFETRAPNWDAFRAARLPGHGYVATDTAGTVLGWVEGLSGVAGNGVDVCARRQASSRRLAAGRRDMPAERLAEVVSGRSLIARQAAAAGRL